MLRFLLDTNTCIRVLRDRPAMIRQRFNEQATALSISTIVLHELLFGAAKSGQPSRHRHAVEDFASRLSVLEFDEVAADHAGDIRATLAAAGQTIGVLDVLIAGHARSRGLIVVTSNTHEFSRVAGLRVEDWLLI